MTSPLVEKQTRAGVSGPLRPRDAATLLLIDRDGANPRVLMGRRGSKHVFMPDLYVFPGGRRDRGDSRRSYLRDVHPDVIARLVGEGLPPARARGLAQAAIRELFEETGLSIGRMFEGGRGGRFLPDLGGLRYVARAITPPGNVRRFDTRFFAAFVDETGIDPMAVRDSDELGDLRWLDMGALCGLNMPDITRTILDEIAARMRADPSLPFDGEGPFYFSRRGQLHRASI